MATDTNSPTTESPTSLNAQDFSGSDDDIMDNFAEGPDDGMPMGLGGEKGKQAEPASTTLEADIVNGTTKQSGEKLPPDDSAGESEPIQDSAGETDSETNPEPPTDESDTPEFPPALLQMAGLDDAKAAQAAGFQNPDALFAAIKWRSQLLAPGAQPAQPDQSSLQGIYRRSPTPTPEVKAAPAVPGETKGFQLPDDKLEMLDEDLQDVIRQMNDHYQQEVESLRASVGQRESELARQQEMDEAEKFDEAVQALGDEWQDVFGEGSIMNLAQNGQVDPAAMTNVNQRVMLLDAVEAVREVNSKQGYKPMALEQEIRWALMQRYPDKFQQTISGNSKGNGKPRGVTASRPTQRNTPPKSQNFKVLNEVNAMLKKRKGYSLDMGHEEEFEGEI